MPFGILKKVFSWFMPDPPKQLAPGAELTSAETDAAIPKIYGKVQKQRGNIVFKETNDNDDDDYPNDLLHIIIVWSESVESIDEVYIDDIPYSSDDKAFYHDDKKIINVELDGGKAVYVLNFPNGMGNYYDATLARAGWRADDRLDGKACSYIRLEYHGGENAISSEPNLTADITGTTFTNPARALRDYLTNPIYGKGLNESFIDTSSFDYAEALCDSDVEEQIGAGRMRDLFSCNVALDTSNTVLDNVNTLLKPMRGWLPVVNGKLKLIIEEDSAPVSVPILDDDVLEIGKITEGNKNSRFNRVSVTYYDPEADGTKQEAVYPEKDSAKEAELLAEDNGVRLETSVDLKTCRNYYEALEFAKTYLEVSRQQMRAPITLPKWATIFEVGDIVPVTYMRGLPFWNEKPFRIESMEESRDEVILYDREHQPYIYDFFGEGNKPELPDTTYTSNDPDEPTDLTIQHIYSNFEQVKVSWVSVAQRFDYRVLKGDVVVRTERIAANEVSLSGFDLGEYRFQVRALSGLGKRSGWAEIALIMQEPGIPTSIQINASNQELEVIPFLAGSDSSTAFEYAISYDVNETEVPSQKRGPAHAYTFTGLNANTEYKVWVRSHNALGESAWISQLATTTADAGPLLEILNPVFEPINIAIGDLDSRFTSLEANTLDIVQQEQQSRLDAEALLLTSISENASYQIELARRIEEGEELTNAVVFRDPENGLIVNRAFSYADDKFTEASLIIDGVEGEVNAAVKRIEQTEDDITNLSSELSLIPGVITAQATAIVSESLAALEPAHAFNFFDSAQGWQAVNGTLTAGVNEITVTHGDIEHPALNYSADSNKLIRVSLERLAGTGWTGTVIIERDDGSTETFANYVQEAGILLIDFAPMSNYTGTITRVRLILGATVADEFKITAITIGKSDATTQDLANITARVNTAELQINANDAAIQQRVTTSFFNANAVTISNVESTVNALDSVIALEATRQELLDNDVVAKANTASTFINGQTGTIQDIVQTFEQDIDSVETSITDVQQQVNGLGITEQVAGLASQQVQTYDVQAGLLQQAVNDLSSYLSEAEEAQSVALALNQLEIDVSPEGALAKDINTLQAATVFNGNAITATNERLSLVETDNKGNATAINAIQGKVDDPITGNSALYTFAQEAKTVADSAEGKANANASSITTIASEVNTADNKAASALTLASQLDQALDEYRATAQLKVDANGNVSFIQLDATPDISQILFKSAIMAWVDQDDNPRVYWDASKSRFVFDGEIRAESGYFKGLLRSNSSENIGSNFMELSNPDGFGPDNLTYYYGPKFLTGNDPDYTQATKANATIWRDTEGDSYYGGSLSAGVLSNAARSTLLTLNPSVEVGPFTTNGRQKTVVYGVGWRGFSSISGECAPGTVTPECTVALYRSVGGSGWQLLQTKTPKGTVRQSYFDEIDKCATTEELSATWTFTDQTEGTDNFMYKVVISNQKRWHALQFIESQTVSLIITEE